MGEDGDGLYHLVVDLVLDFYKDQGQTYGEDGSSNDKQDVQENGVEENLPYSLVVE